MARLEISLLGPFQATLDGVPVAHFETQKTCALLAYLAVETQQPHSREILAEMLWPDRPEGAARANLRHTLGDLRNLLGAPSPSDKAAAFFLSVTRDTIQLNPEADGWVDTTAFIKLLTDSTPNTKLPIEQLEEAAGLYRGAFLEDFNAGDSPIFQEWVIIKREQFQCQIIKVLSQLSKCYAILGNYNRALEYARRQAGLSPWDEAAHQQVMYYLALTGQQGAALDYYKTSLHVLSEELGITPGRETEQLFEQIRSGKLKTRTALPTMSQLQPAIHLPGFLKEDAVSTNPPVFVARERELAQLDASLRDMLNSHTRLVFVTGDAGQGKTSLINAFARRAMDRYSDLLVASGNCNAYAGAGDPYLPFRDVMNMLTGDVENRWAAGLIGREHARRLWKTQTLAIQALISGGSSLIDTILSGEALLLRAAIAAPDSVAWLERLEELNEQRLVNEVDLEQSHLFEQYINVLRFLADRHPLMILLDDLQWADTSSISLLFHLGRRLAGSRVLILCAYRPGEVASETSGELHPLAKVLLEFKRSFGDVWVDLNGDEEAEGRRFVDALLDTDPNRLTQAFRSSFFHRTEGHPLFAVELLRSMQERHDLIKDKDGCWIETPALDWELLPARVEAVIEERISRLDQDLKCILSVACVEGEIFSAQVVAEVQGIPAWSLRNRLSQELERQHSLVIAQDTVQTKSGRIFRYKFSHVLFRDFLYKRLSRVERQFLHGEVAVALEKRFAGQVDEIAAQLAHHFSMAGEYERTFHYFGLAAERAARLYANEQTIDFYTQAIGIAAKISPSRSELIGFYHRRGLAWETTGDFERSRTDYETALTISREAGIPRLEWHASIDLAKLWASRDCHQSLDYYGLALKLAREIDDPAILAESLNGMGNWYINDENPRDAIRSHREALSIFRKTRDQLGLASTLDMLGIASLLSGDSVASVGYYDQAIALFRELDDRPGLASSLTGCGNNGGGAYYNLTVAPAIQPYDAQRDFEEAIELAREIGSPASEAWVQWCLGLLFIVTGDFDHALVTLQDGLRIASEIKHLEWMVGTQTVLGICYLEMFALEDARRQFDQALIYARELSSQYWIHLITGSLAAAHRLQGNLKQAQACLDSVLTPLTPMDTLNKRYCWARRAELALSLRDPAHALEITDRLITSSPGKNPGSVITFLWKLKGEALAVLGQPDHAVTLLREAVENAQATRQRFLLWRAQASLGHVYQIINNPSAAQEAYNAARVVIGELAATIPNEPMKDCFLQGAKRELNDFPDLMGGI